MTEQVVGLEVFCYAEADTEMHGLSNFLTSPPFLGGWFVFDMASNLFFRAYDDTLVLPEKVEIRMVK